MDTTGARQRLALGVGVVLGVGFALLYPRARARDPQPVADDAPRVPVDPG